MAPLDTGIVVVVERGGGLTVVDGVSEVGEAGDHISCVESEPGTHVVARISASHELRAVRSWQSAFHAIGPPDRMTIAPLILRNLKSGS